MKKRIMEKEKNNENCDLVNRKNSRTYLGLKKKDLEVLHLSNAKKQALQRYELTEVDEQKRTILITDVLSEDDDLASPEKRDVAAESLLATDRIEGVVLNGGYAGCVDDMGTIYTNPTFQEYLKNKYANPQQNLDRTL